MNPTELEQRLEAPHLSPAELKEGATAALEKSTAVQKKDLNDDPRAQVEFEFEFSYTDARGKLWEGTFIHRIPTLAQRDIIDLMQARKKVDNDIGAFTRMAVERHLYVCHLEVCLTKRPKWADNLEVLLDPGIVEALYGRAASHEAYFLGWGQGDDVGGAEREDGDSGSASMVE